MATQCNDIETLLPTYLDGELASHDQLSFEHHMADCTGCRDRVRAEGAYRGRVRELLTPPAAPDGLTCRVREALDREDGRMRAGRRRFGRSWLLPISAGLSAAAALVLFVASEARHSADSGGDGMAAQAGPVGARPQRPPIGLSMVGLGYLGDARPPATWRPLQAMFDVQMVDGRHHDVGLQVMEAGGLDLSRHSRWVRKGTELFVQRGAVNSVVYCGGGTICMVFASDMEPEQLVGEVMRVGLVP